MRGGRYSSKEMEDDKRDEVKDKVRYKKKRKNEEKPTKEILSVCYTRACI